MSVNSTNPSNYFGGTWEQIKDRFLVACGSTYSNGATGEGTAMNNIRISRGDYGLAQGGLYGGQTMLSITKNSSGSSAQSLKDNGIDFIPPYLAVYIWKRVA